ncbi:hypothetical protein DAI22_08g233300 [Oryza sativa Japonica Group]|nr:hypothetical protein DAI22_08g233300 [Oryza sativa Japonica Group]
MTALISAVQSKNRSACVVKGMCRVQTFSWYGKMGMRTAHMSEVSSRGERFSMVAPT